jgi:hypothetical protein
MNHLQITIAVTDPAQQEILIALSARIFMRPSLVWPMSWSSKMPRKTLQKIIV